MAIFHTTVLHKPGWAYAGGGIFWLFQQCCGNQAISTGSSDSFNIGKFTGSILLLWHLSTSWPTTTNRPGGGDAVLDPRLLNCSLIWAMHESKRFFSTDPFSYQACAGQKSKIQRGCLRALNVTRELFLDFFIWVSPKNILTLWFRVFHFLSSWHVLSQVTVDKKRTQQEPNLSRINLDKLRYRCDIPACGAHEILKYN